jgi:ATP-binding cassette subfamily C (CFTR/MRP) protein 1
LQSIDFKALRGEFICIIGDVGCGKTSLLKSIIGDLIYISNDEIQS